MAEIIYTISFYIALAALLLVLIRMIIGPTSVDRTISLDMMTIISIPILVYISMISMRIIYLDVAMVYTLISFIGVVAIARYLEGGF